MAISINCIAEVLEDKNDEILFVDYNTPDHLPTIIEDIEDTLTKKAKDKLRIFRIRPKMHKQFLQSKTTHLNVIEPLARNVAIRRSNPKNKWILSTNTDMVFVPRGSKALTALVAPLSTKYHYQIPRFEIPESLWNLQDRKDPEKAIKNFYFYGYRFYINHITHGDYLYDAPGDFQLISRDVMFDIAGFDEDMILGWHVDSNLIKRLDLLGLKLQSLFPSLYGYHCNHTKAFSIMHASKTKSINCLEKYYYSVSTPYLPLQSQNWGLNNQYVEEISLKESNKYTTALQKVLYGDKSDSISVSYFEKCIPAHQEGIMPYNYKHLISYLMDFIVTLDKNCLIGYLGYNVKLVLDVNKILSLMNFVNHVKMVDTNTLNAINVLIIDCGTTRKKVSIQSLCSLLLKLFRGARNPTCIFVGACNTKYEIVLKHFFDFNRPSVVSNCILSYNIKKLDCLKNIYIPFKASVIVSYQIFLLMQVKWKLIPYYVSKGLSPYPKIKKNVKKLYRMLKLNLLFLS